MTITTADVWEATSGLLAASSGPAAAAFERGVIDSREVREGDLFFALRGERTDGHEYVAQALAAGARGAVVERPMEARGDAAVFHVSDSLAALQRLAAFWRRKHDVRTIGITGSVGKTTCKELTAALLARRYRVLKSEANLNTEIGIPLTLLNLRQQHQQAVLEFGMYGRGEIALLSRIAQPHVGVVTNIGPVHLERLGSLDAIADAKAELVEALPPGGLAVLNGDDARTAALAQRTRARTTLYGTSTQCDVRATEVVSRGLEGISFDLTAGGETVRVDCPLPGKHHVYPAAAAAAVAMNEGVTLREAAGALRTARPDLRMRVLRSVRGCTIIDDTYNASPASMLAALDLLSELSGRRIAVLAEMRELGAASDEGHRRVGTHAAAACDVLLAVGAGARLIAEAAQEAGCNEVLFEETVTSASEWLRREVREGDHVLFKGSRAVGLEAAVDALVAR